LGDGATIDASGRVYVIEHGPQDGIDVFSNKGEPLGVIPTAGYPGRAK